jgi:myo-inositol-1(or 4)-monophosphatase
MAAGDLIVREAGGIVSDHLGLGFRYNGKVPVQRSILAANPRLHAALLERLKHINLR